MFKVSFDLPEKVVQEEPPQQKKKKHQQQTAEKLGADDLQKMMNELKKDETQTPRESKRERKRNRKAKANTDVTEEIAEEVMEKADAEVPSEDTKPKTNAKATKQKESKKEPTTALKRKAEEPEHSSKKLTPLQLKMQQKLSGARFRWINEQLYTSNSERAFDIFQKQPEVFKEYHDGFRHQVEQWPENPVLNFVNQFKDRLVKPLNAPGGLPGDKAANKVVVADMGCGEAELALKLSAKNFSRRKTGFEVHSFDMNKANDRITVADIKHVPLPDESCHVVVFCLALMGTNLADFVNEGIRILKPNGLVWIAEIKSRFEKDDYASFVENLKNMGLYHRTTDDSNKMFVKFEFVKLSHKLANAKNKNPEILLKPCIYKRR